VATLRQCRPDRQSDSQLRIIEAQSISTFVARPPIIGSISNLCKIRFS